MVVILTAALNDALKEEIQHLKVLTGQAMQNGGPMMSYTSFGGGQQQYYANNHAMHTLLTAQQLQQLQIHSQKQQQQQHQFQQHHQLQQQHHQEQQQQQQAGDVNMRGSVSSQNQKDNAASDVNPPAMKE